jgi:hypothetical protein
MAAANVPRGVLPTILTLPGGYGFKREHGLAPEEHSAANSLTALGDFSGFLKASIIKKQPGVVAR